MEEIQTKMDFLDKQLVKNPDQMSDDEKKQYLTVLRNVVEMAGEKKEQQQVVATTTTTSGGETKFAEREDEGGGAIIQIRGKFPLGMTALTVMPLKKELQKAFDTLGSKSLLYGIRIEVLSVFSERNFNFIQQRVVNSNSLFEEDELFVKMGSPEQASCILGSIENVFINISARPCIVRFSAPSYGTRMRSTYREIGRSMKRLHYTDNELKTIGAIPHFLGGIPMLPENLVHWDEFDAAVENFRGEKNGKQDLHMYLVSKIRVDRRRIESVFESLVNERINILLKLCYYDQHETPFSFTRSFSV